jgi:8-oxo-dGTP pyrophosphatase MutT (NUDIX family)
MTETSPKPIRAAGGIVRGAGQNTGKLLVVRRRRYGGEVGLPKGKLVEGEDEAAAALREVEEETGLRPVLRQHVGRTHYSVHGRPKTVAYFVMDAIDDNVASPRDTGEIDATEWLTPGEAVAALTHDDDRKLVAGIFGIAKEAGR